MYQRVRKNGTTHCYEVFEVKIIKAGTIFAKGTAPTTEDAESYPGKSAFGKYAYCCANMEQAEQRYEQLLATIKNRTDKDDVPLSDDSEAIKTKPNGQIGAAKGNRGRKPKDIKMPIPKKGEKFTMKRLMMWSGESQPNLYNRLKVLLEMGLVGIAGEVRMENTRGKAQILYVSNTDEYASNIVLDNASDLATIVAQKLN